MVKKRWVINIPSCLFTYFVQFNIKTPKNHFKQFLKLTFNRFTFRKASNSKERMGMLINGINNNFSELVAPMIQISCGGKNKYTSCKKDVGP